MHRGKVDPGVSELPRGNELSRDHVNRPYDAPFCEQQYTHGTFYITLFKFKSFDQLIPPKLPQILDIYSVVAL